MLTEVASPLATAASAGGNDESRLSVSIDEGQRSAIGVPTDGPLRLGTLDSKAGRPRAVMRPIPVQHGIA